MGGGFRGRKWRPFQQTGLRRPLVGPVRRGVSLRIREGGGPLEPGPGFRRGLLCRQLQDEISKEEDEPTVGDRERKMNLKGGGGAYAPLTRCFSVGVLAGAENGASELDFGLEEPELMVGSETFGGSLAVVL